MKILVKSNQRNYDNCELLDCRVVGLGGLEPPVWVDSNHRPHPYQGCALTKLSYRPIKMGMSILPLESNLDN